MILGVSLSLVLFIGFTLLGMPVYGAVFAALFAAIFSLALSPTVILTDAFYSINSYILVAIPLFLLMGDLMTEGGMSSRLVAFANALIGRVKGGLAHVMVLACLFFGTLTGSSLTTTIAIGSIMIPLMVEYGWDRRYASTLAACAAPLGALIPPSIVGILYAYVAQVSVGRIFLATVVPGVILAVSYMVINYFWGVKWYHPVALPAGKKSIGMGKELARAIFTASPALIAPLVILGGIYGGIFTATEASAIGVAYALIVGFFIYRGLRGKNTSRVIMVTAMSTAAIFLIIVPMAPYVKGLIMRGVGNALTNFVVGTSNNVYIILLMLNILLLILGMFIDGIPVLLAIVPLLLPALDKLGLDPIHIGAVILVNLLLGPITPPFALNLFVACRIGKVPYAEVLKLTYIFLATAAVPTLLLTTYIPQLSLWLPNFVMGPGR